MTRLQHQQSLLLQLLLVPILISRSVMAAPPRQKTLPWPLPLPPINTGLRQQGEQEGSAIIFKVWESLAKTELADQAAGEDEAAFTLFTLRDEAWMLHMFG